MVQKFITSQAAVDDHKLSENNSIPRKSYNKKNHLHSLVKALKPKVYILTDSSTFKNLVQELTGNGNVGCTSVSDPSASLLSFHSSDHHVGSISIPDISDFPPWSITSDPNDHDQVPVTWSNMIYTIGDYGFQESSPELSFDSSDHDIDLTSIPVASHFSQDQEFQNTWDLTSFPQEYEEMESWLLEMDSYVNNNYGSYWLQPVMPPEICAFDCDLSAIM